jgi:DNA mismatch endonuclease (patch repair protein)
MRAIKSKQNRTETILRKLLHAMGFRYRLYPRGVTGKPDFIFIRQRVAVFVDGDFWHARVVREQGFAPNVSRLSEPAQLYWTGKFQKRIVRDDFVTSELTRQGWTVLRFWESDIRSDINSIVNRIASVLREKTTEADELIRPHAGKSDLPY